MNTSTTRTSNFAMLFCLILGSFGAAAADTVVVKKGDTVIGIAERELGQRARFTEICKLNQRALKYDCNYISEGMVLVLPPRNGQQETRSTRPAAESDDLPNKVTSDSVFVARFNRNDAPILHAPEGYTATQARDYVMLSGYKADASPGVRPGIYLQLPEWVEKQASGKSISVRAVVRMQRTPGPIALAYATADVGTSGWVTKSAGTQFKSVTFRYKVPVMKAGRGDYIGILPDPRGIGQVLYVAEIAVDILPD